MKKEKEEDVSSTENSQGKDSYVSINLNEDFREDQLRRRSPKLKNQKPEKEFSKEKDSDHL